MVAHGAGFGVDLYELEVAAKEDLPTVSADYSAAVGSCNQVKNELDGAMRRDPYFGDTLGPVHTSYVALHDVVARHLISTRNNLDDLAIALGNAVKTYAENDAAAKADLDRRLRDEPPQPPQSGR